MSKHFSGRSLVEMLSGRSNLSKGESRSRSSLFKVVTGIAIFSIFATVLTVVTTEQPAEAIPPFPINDTGSGTAGGLNPNWQRVLTGTGNTGGQYTSDGWTRLTNSGLNQSTNLLNSAAFPSSTGIQVEFDYRMAGGQTFGGQTGDGMSMYLVNGVAGVSAGALGSGLAYSGNANGCGVQQGYLGVGLDVFGAFSTPSSFASGGPGSRPEAISVRGSGTSPCTANQVSNFPWVSGANVAGLWTGVNGNTQDPALLANSLFRRVRVTVVPNAGNVQVTVALTAATLKTMAPGAFAQVLTTNLTGVAGQVALPSTLRLGFGAGVGGATNFQDIRNISVRALTDLSVAQVRTTAPAHAGVASGSFLPGDQVTFTGTSRNLGPSTIGNAPTGVARYFQDLSALPLSNVTWTCVAAGGAACVNASGSGSTISANWTGPLGSSVVVTATGTITAARGNFTAQSRIPTNFTNNTVGANGSTIQVNGGAIDTNTVNNTASTVFTVATPLLSQTKTVTPTSVGVGQPVTYTVNVTNTGTGPGTATFSDSAPVTVTPTAANCVGAGGATCNATLAGRVTTGSMTIPAGGSVAYTIQAVGASAGSAQNSATVTVTTPGCTAVCGGGVATSPPATVQPVSLELVKTASVGGLPADNVTIGDPVTYQFAVTNTGGVAVGSLQIEEIAFTGTGVMPVISCPVTTLAPLASTVCSTTVPYIITTEDVVAGTITNEARARASISNRVEPVLSPNSTAVVTALLSPSIEVVKASDSGPVSAAGDVINYVFTVTNNGNVPLTDVAINEKSFSGSGAAPAIDCGPAAALIQPLETITCTATYTVTQADINAGVISNTVVASSTAPDLSSVTSDDASYSIVPLSNPELSLTKSVQPLVVSDPGEIADYTVIASNTGNVTLTEVAVAEMIFTGSGPSPSLSCSPATTTLEPGETLTCSAQHETTQADVEAGGFTNTAQASATGPQETQISSPTASATVIVAQSPGLSLSGVADPDFVSVAGESVGVTFVATNVGNVTISGLSVVVDAFTGSGVAPGITCASVAPLAPGVSVECSLDAPYVVTQADVDAGGFSVIADASGTTVAGPVAAVPVTVRVDAATAPELQLSASVVPAGPGAYTAGTVVTVNYVVENTGNVTVRDVEVLRRSFSGSGSVPVIGCVGTAPFALAPGDSLSCSASYTLTQVDVDAGVLGDVSYASGLQPDDSALVSNDATVSLVITADPVLTAVASAVPSSVNAAGDSVGYSVVVSNEGTVTLDGVSVVVDSFTGAGVLPGVSCPAGIASMAPGDSVTCTVTYVVTQADMNGGAFTFEVHATGAAPDSSVVSSTSSSVVVTVVDAPALTLDTRYSLSPAGVQGAGQVVNLEFEMTNAGNLTLANAGTSISVFSGSAASPTVTCPGGASSLAPGASVVCVASYSLTQADVDAGFVDLTAVAGGVAPFGAVTAISSGPVDTSIAIPRTSELGLVFSVDPTQVDAAGDRVTYTMTVTNTGVVTVNAVSITQNAFTGSGVPTGISCPVGVASLAPGASVTCTSQYDALQADIDAGGFVRTVTATGSAPGSGVVSSETQTTTVTSSVTPSLSLVKSADPSDEASFVVGQELTFYYVARNTGNVTLANIDVTEQSFTGSGVSSPITCPAGASSLAPKTTVRCTSTYTLTQADIDADSIENVAIAHGDAPSGINVTSNASSITLPAPPLPELSLVKSGTRLTPEEFVAGASITYTFDVINVGNLTLFGAQIVETEFTGSDALSGVTCPAEAATLFPGEGVQCTATYALTQEDVDRGTLKNSAIARATTPRVSDPVDSPESTYALPVDQRPSLALTQTVAPDVATRAGDWSIFTFTLTNTGNVTISDAALRNFIAPLFAVDVGVTCTFPVTRLSPGQATSCSVRHDFTQEEIDRGTFVNAVAARGTAPDGSKVLTEVARAKVSLEPLPYLGLALKGTPATVGETGEVIDYVATVTNLGTVTLTTISVLPDSFTGSGTLESFRCDVSTLAPGVSTDCVTSYSVTLTDLERASAIELTASASAVSVVGEATVLSPSQTSVVDVTPPAPRELMLTGVPSGRDLALFALILFALGLVLNTQRISRRKALR